MVSADRLGLLLLIVSQVTFSQTFDKTQNIGTHNSYWLEHTPKQQIEQFGVRQIELDFGMVNGEFYIGHDHAEPKFGMCSLDSWLRNVVKARVREPIILKLDIKNWGVWNPDWRHELIKTLESRLGNRWFKAEKFRKKFEGVWPDIRQMRRAVVVMVSRTSRGQQLPEHLVFKGNKIDEYTIKNASNYTQFKNFQKSGVNLIILDEQYAHWRIGDKK